MQHFLLIFNVLCQGLYEYVKPSWQERVRPTVDENKLKSFGANVAPRPLNPTQGELQVYPATGRINDADMPR